MTLTNIEYLALLPIFFIIWLAARKPRQWVNIPALRQTKRSSIISRFVLSLPIICWLLLSFLFVLILATPTTTKKTSFVFLEKKILVISIDISTSMGEGPNSAMEKIKTMTAEFVHKRRGDYIGISAYSGYPYPSRGRGYARIIMYPTNDLAQLDASIRSLNSRMFGSHTAIGDGIFVSIVALIEERAKEAMGERYDRWLLDKSVDSLGEQNENLYYAQEVINAVGPQKGKFIILFTDGKYNTGMHPVKALWFAKRLGLRVHFLAFESTGPTGLSSEDQMRHKQEIIKAVLETDGLYRESSNVEGVAKLYEEVNAAEKSRFAVEGESREETQQYPLIILAAIIFLFWVIIENVWIKVP